MSPPTLAPMDERVLRELAAEPPQPLFPALRQAEAMAPLVVVLAFLPALYALAHRTLTEAGARQGIVSLQCFSARSLDEFVDPQARYGMADVESSAYQPMLMNWLTALALRMFGVGRVAGHIASAYLCTAALILSSYVLGRRMGGDRLGLFTALLLAFNPHVLQLAQEPLPQSAAALFAVLTMAGIVAHWQKSSSPASIQLLLGGIALGLCLLAGGPVAISIVFILLVYAVCWKFDALRGAGSAVFDRSQWSRRMSIRSIAILAATGFAVGSWRPLWMGSRHGIGFWQTWLGLPVGAADRPSAGSWIDLFVRWNHLVLPLSVLALAGIGVIVFELVQRTEDPGRRHRGLLLVWLLVGGLIWLFRGPDHDVVQAEFWTILLIIPLSIAAAIGLLGIIDRSISFRNAVAIGLATGLDLAWLVGRTPTGQDAAHLTSVDSIGWALAALVASAAVSVTALLSQSNASFAARQRGTLVRILLGLVVANCAWGVIAVRRTNDGDRELEDLRTTLARVSDVSRWTFVENNSPSADPDDPPWQLRYVLSSLWPAAQTFRYGSLEDLAASLSAGPRGDLEGQHLIVVWSPLGRSRAAVPAGLLKAAAPPCVYRDHEVAVFVPGDSPP